MTSIEIVRDYPHSVDPVWRAMTEPALVPRWSRRRGCATRGRAERVSSRPTSATPDARRGPPAVAGRAGDTGFGSGRAL